MGLERLLHQRSSATQNSPVCEDVNGGFSDAERRHFWNRLDGDRRGTKTAQLKIQCLIYDEAVRKSDRAAFSS